MSNNVEERIKILRMIEENRISADQAALLLNALEERPRQVSAPVLEAPTTEEAPALAPEAPTPSSHSGNPAWFRVEVSDMNTGKTKVHVRLPLSLVSWGMKLGARYTDELNGIDMNELMEALRSGQNGKLIEVTDEEDGEHVEIFIE